jgi:peptidylprolyl isomerase
VSRAAHLLCALGCSAIAVSCAAGAAAEKPSGGAAAAGAAAPSTAAAPSGPATAAKPRTRAEVLAASSPADWRQLDPEQTLQLELSTGRVVIELAPAFAPLHVANIKALAREGYFDGLAILRVQDNYVTQWGDPEGGEKGERPIKSAKRTLPGEFSRSSAGLPFTPLADGDIYAPEVGFSSGFPAARDPKSGQTWLTHCYAMLGVGRDNAPDSGGGTELYVVNGHAPRHLDRNVTLAGRVVQGMELLTSLPRGTAAMGFYEKTEQRPLLRSVRVAADLPVAERTQLEALRTDSATFAALVDAHRNRSDAWYLVPAGRTDLCNVPLPVRPRGSAPR